MAVPSYDDTTLTYDDAATLYDGVAPAPARSPIFGVRRRKKEVKEPPLPVPLRMSKLHRIEDIFAAILLDEDET